MEPQDAGPHGKAPSAGGDPAAAAAASTVGAALRDAAFGVTGMTCASCSAVVEKVVSRLPGVTHANVNLAMERLSVTFDPGVVDEARIAEAVKKAGYGTIPLSGGSARAAAPGAPPAADMSATPGAPPAVAQSPATGAPQATITLGLIGMTCSSCATVIEKTLQKVTGVRSAAVNLAAETARVTFDPAVVGIDTLIEAVKGAGYDAVLRVETGSAADESASDAQRTAQLAHMRHQQRLLVFSALLALPAFLISMVPPFMTVVPTGVATWLANTLGGAWDPMMVMKYLAFALVTPVQFVAGAQFYRGFWHALKRRAGNMDTLIAIGTSAAYFYSVAATFVPALQAEPVFFETAALLLTFVILGKLLEARAKGRDRRMRSRSSWDWPPRPRAWCAAGWRPTSRCSRSSPATWWWCAPARRSRSTGW